MTVVAGLEITVAEVTLAPGEDTGWHYHDGPLLVVVRCGTLTREDARGTVSVHLAGDTFLEPPGPAAVHRGRCAGTVPVELFVVYALPPGAPRAVHVDRRCDISGSS